MADVPVLKFIYQGLPIEEASPALRSYLDTCDGAVFDWQSKPGFEQWDLFRGGDLVGTVELLGEEET